VRCRGIWGYRGQDGNVSMDGAPNNGMLLTALRTIAEAERSLNLLLGRYAHVMRPE
jgi:hypothetical protein